MSSIIVNIGNELELYVNSNGEITDAIERHWTGYNREYRWSDCLDRVLAEASYYKCQIQEALERGVL